MAWGRMFDEGTRLYLCSHDEGCTQVVDTRDCPNAASHRLGPLGYMASLDWLEEMSETHDQLQCPSCGLWLIWTPKPMTHPNPC